MTETSPAGVVEELLYSRHNPVQTRTVGAELVNVRHKQRLIDVVAVPYNTPTLIQDIDGAFEETIDPAAFAGVETRAARVKVLRDHDPERIIGKGHAMYPDRPDGLHATLQVARTPLGDETLELASENVLDCSIGFMAMQNGSVWDRAMTAVRHVKLFLAEISMVPFPAYEGAVVAGVRMLGAGNLPRPVTVEDDPDVPAAPLGSSTPVMDQLLAAIEAERYAKTRILT